MKVKKELLRVFLLTFCLAPTCTSYNDFNTSLIRSVSTASSKIEDTQDQEKDRDLISVAHQGKHNANDSKLSDILEHDPEIADDTVEDEDKENITPTVVIPHTGSDSIDPDLSDSTINPDNLFLPFGVNPLFGGGSEFDFDIIGTPGNSRSNRGTRSPVFNFGNFGMLPGGIWNFNPGTVDVDLDDMLGDVGNDNDSGNDNDNDNGNDFDFGNPGDDFVIVIDPIDPGPIDVGNGDGNGNSNGDIVDVPAPQTALLIFLSIAILLYNRKFTP